MKKNVLITVENFNQDFSSAIKAFEDKNYTANWIPLDVESSSPKSLIELASGSIAVIAGGEYWTEEILYKLRHTLKAIVRFGSGYDKIDLSAAMKYDVAVANSPGTFSRAVAESTLSLILNILREITYYNNELFNGHWKPRITNSLYNKKIGILGFGSIGRAFSELLAPFTKNIMYYDKVDSEKVTVGDSIRSVALDELIHESDIISVNLPLTEETYGFINKEFFRKMKNDSILINTSRGKVINEKDLIHALKSQEIAAAGLDVFEDEPLNISNELLTLSNVVLTPHAAALTTEAFQKTIMSCVDSVFKLIETGTCENIIT